MVKSSGEWPVVSCVDCIAEGVTTRRPITSGARKPRCATHTRAAKKRAKATAHARTVEATYGISGEQYWALYEAQGGKCAICQVATGKSKRLAVDHDHRCTADHPPDRGCPQCIRGLLCSPCNVIIGRLGQDALVRALGYLLDPPALRLVLQNATPA